MSISPIGPSGLETVIRQADSNNPVTAEKSFSEFIKSGIEQVNQALVNGDKAIERLHSGEAENLHEVMLAIEQADISLRMFVQIRNKALQAYEEIGRLQV